MRSARQNDDLTREPRIEEALADPVIQAVMARDHLSRDDVLRVVRAAQARLHAAQGQASPGDAGHAAHGVVTPFPAHAVRASAPAVHPADRRDVATVHPDEIDLRPTALRCCGGSLVEE